MGVDGTDKTAYPFLAPADLPRSKLMFDDDGKPITYRMTPDESPRWQLEEAARMPTLAGETLKSGRSGAEAIDSDEKIVAIAQEIASKGTQPDSLDHLRGGLALLSMPEAERDAHLEFRDAAREARATAEAAQRAAKRYQEAIKRLSEVCAPPTVSE